MNPPAGERLPAQERAWTGRLEGRLGRPLHIFSVLDSALDTLAELAEAGAATGCCVLAEDQRHGRGRRARGWESPPGASLLMALLLRPASDPARGGLIALAAALALLRAARPLGVDLQVKWPNDILHRGRKLAGILAEARLDSGGYRHLLLGVGINVHQGRGDFPPELRDRACSLDMAAGRRLERADLLAAYLRELEALLDDLAAGEADALLAAWRSAWPHRGWRARDERGRILVLLDVGDGGELLVSGPEGTEALHAGDLAPELLSDPPPGSER